MPAPAFLFTSPHRVLYRGALGQPGARVFGAAAWYVGLRGPLRWTLPDSGAQSVHGEGDVLGLAPGVVHHIAVADGPVLCYLIEPESTVLPSDPSGWPVAGADGSLPLSDWRAQLLALDGEALGAWEAHPIDAALDRLLLGQALPTRPLDARIRSVVAHVQRDPALAWQAADAARHCGLSPSRFMHLFKAEVGTGWRAFRAWKRARGLLERVHSGENLTHLAQTLGYPDATHFSHAIRQITGLRPSDIVTGSRQLDVRSEPGTSPDAAS